MHILLLSLSFAAPVPPTPPPAAIRPSPTQEQAQQQPRKRVMIGCPKPKWRARTTLGKLIAETEGQPAVRAYYDGQIWLSEHVAEDRVSAQDGRTPGLSALVALALMGNSSTSNAGMLGRSHVGPLLRGLREDQDAETGAVADRGAATFAVDQALALHALSEAYFSDETPRHESAAQLALEALLSARAEDGLWHVGGPSGSEVDPLACGLAAYAMFSARDADLQVPEEPLKALLAWSGEAPLGEGGVDTAAVLTARIYSAAALGSSLVGDARVKELSALLAKNIPDVDAGEGTSQPELAADPLFCYLATLTLYQADNASWGRFDRWLRRELLSLPAEEAPDAGAWPAGPGARGLPDAGSRVTRTALYQLALQSAVREQPSPVLVQ